MTLNRVSSIAADYLEVTQWSPSFSLGQFYSEIALWRLAINKVVLLTLLIGIIAKIMVQLRDQRLNIILVGKDTTNLKIIKGCMDEACLKIRVSFVNLGVEYLFWLEFGIMFQVSFALGFPSLRGWFVTLRGRFLYPGDRFFYLWRRYFEVLALSWCVSTITLDLISTQLDFALQLLLTHLNLLLNFIFSFSDFNL